MAINTLITIKDALTEFVNGHSQLKKIGFEADDHRASVITQFDEFPILFVAPIDVLVGRAMNTHTLRIYVYERINDDRLDVWENANDTSLILRDIRVWWNDYGSGDINIIEDPIGTFGSDRELDNLVGYFADFRFEIPSHGRCQVPVNITPTPIPPPPCEPATVTVNDNEFATVPSGETIDVPVVNNGSNPVGAIQGSQVVIGNSEVEINGVQVGDVVAEESLSISVELDGTPAGSWNATDQVWEVNSSPCPNATLTLDSEPFLTVASGSTTNITLEDEDGNPVSPIGSDGSVIVVPNSSIVSNSGVQIVSGNTISIRTGDDGDVRSGRLVDWFTLDYLNPFGNNNRFTDEFGGQTYTSGLMCDWAFWDKSTGLFHLWDKRINAGNANVNVRPDVIIPQVFSGTYHGKTGWIVPNKKTLDTIVRDLRSVTSFNYSPISESTIYAYMTSSYVNSSQILLLNTANGSYLVNDETLSAYRYKIFRLTNISEL